MTNNIAQSETVLVTGGSGFIGAHCIIQLLEAGYRVQTTVRSLKREADVRAMLKTGGVDAGDALTFFAADLTSDAGWVEAITGCDYVLHVASPFPTVQPKDENELIVPAREGALRVLRAARDAGVKRIVLTSSFAAIGYGNPTDQTFTEETWTNLNGKMTPYAKSKTIAERAAWDFIEKEGGSLQLAVVNPVGVVGPVLGKDLSSSIELLVRLLNGGVLRAPRTYFNYVDVRDVADLHLRVMTNPAAIGQRFLATEGNCLSMLDVARILRKNLGAAASKTPTAEFPDWIVRVGGLFVPALSSLIPSLGIVRRASNEKARKILGWSPRTNEEGIVAAAESLIQLGLISN